MASSTVNVTEMTITSQAATLGNARYGATISSLYELWQARELLWLLVERDVKVHYREAVLGIAWAILTPLLFMVVLTLIFGVMGRMGPVKHPYPVFLFPAWLTWNYFNSTSNRGANSLMRNSSLITRIYIPRLLFPLANAISPFVDLAIGMVVLSGLLIYYGYYPTWRVVFVPFFLLLAMFCALGVSTLLGALNARYRDIRHVLPVLMRIWFFCTPVIYHIERIPEKWHNLYALNPMVTVMIGLRWCFIGMEPPTIVMVTEAIVFIMLLLFVGMIVFRYLEKTVTDVL